ncbi:hypothetical protein ACFFJT_07365 [Dyella flava]|uniref:Uncharacterized protein n=1 Tax=Dyella flava TaxID=1920170 RepID=A0ABS2K8D6_9GAMM|nr:hypothetical protein [Dyella flava]MBM7127409.1 hypothetical protein [Dyella flava]GLQ51007.1 hypothetical protein GCM10010872_24560 [Dyella flava]
MTQTPHTQLSSARVNWNDPELSLLLKRSENWQLDNRGGFTPQDVQVYLGWSSTVGRSAMLVWERDKSVVLEVDFPLGKGDQVRVDKHLGDSIRTLWGVVVEGREGVREEDRRRGIHLYWLQVR